MKSCALLLNKAGVAPAWIDRRTAPLRCPRATPPPPRQWNILFTHTEATRESKEPNQTGSAWENSCTRHRETEDRSGGGLKWSDTRSRLSYKHLVRLSAILTTTAEGRTRLFASEWSCLNKPGRLWICTLWETEHLLVIDLERVSRVANLFLNARRAAETKVWKVAGQFFGEKHHECVLQMEASDLQQTIARRLVYVKPNESAAHSLSRLLATWADGDAPPKYTNSSATAPVF